jgi:hypothetical protein
MYKNKSWDNSNYEGKMAEMVCDEITPCTFIPNNERKIVTILGKETEMNTLGTVYSETSIKN